MATFLSLLRREYGSADGYLEANGASRSLVDRLKDALLIRGAPQTIDLGTGPGRAR